MHLAAFAILAIASANLGPISEPTGSYSCHLWQQGSCPVAEDEDSVCIGGAVGKQESKRYKLEVNFKSKRIRLNGIEGYFQPDREAKGYRVHWRISGLGEPVLSYSLFRNQTILTFTNVRVYGSSHSDFKCS